MFLKSLSFGVAVFALAATAPSFAQIFWQNQTPAGISDDIWSVTYANGTFAAVTNRGNLLTSPDGLTWSSQPIDPGVWLVSIAYGNGLWVVAGDKGTILESGDLKTWVSANSGTSNKLNGVLYSGTYWVAVGEAGTIVTSPDALTWMVQPAIPGVTGFLHGITLAAGQRTGQTPVQQYILVCGANGVILSAANPTDSTTPITFSGGPAYFSEYGQIPPQNLEAIYGAEPSPGGNIVVGWGGTIIDFGIQDFASSPYITNYVPSVVFRGLTYGNGYYVAAGEQGTIVTSPDGVVWTSRFSGNSPSTLTASTLLSAAYSSTLQRFVLTGTGGAVLVSGPSPSVFANVSTRGLVSSAQAFIGGFVIEGTAPRTILIRADGPALSSFGVSNSLPDPVLTIFNGSGTVIATNAGWTANANPSSLSSAALEVGAFPLSNPSKDSALLLTLPPGAYTAQITSAAGNSGATLFEAYAD